MIKISAVLITFNESAIIRKTLAQLWWCNEIIVVDSGSTDDTLFICKQYGCRIFLRPFTGYGDQKRFAISKSSNDYVLSIDADECLSDALVDELIAETKKPEMLDGYRIPMNLVFRGHEFKYGKESNRYFLRLFHKSKGGMNADTVHESILVNGKTGRFKNKILHYSYPDLTNYFNKFNLYTSLGAVENIEKHKYRSQVLIILTIPLYFLKYFILERNMLNGINGFYWSILSACSHFVKYIKMRDLLAVNNTHGAPISAQRSLSNRNNLKNGLGNPLKVSPELYINLQDGSN